MITRPDLLFQKPIEQIAEQEQLELAVLEEKKRQEAFYSRQDDDPIKQFDKELIESFEPNVATFEPIDFPRDFGLDTLVRDFLTPRFSGLFQYNALGRSPADLPTIQYRWEVHDELDADRQKTGQLEAIAEQLTSVFKLLHSRRKMLSFKTVKELWCSDVGDLMDLDLSTLVRYAQAIRALAKVTENPQSHGLQAVNDYAARVMQTGQFQTIARFLDDYGRSNYVELGVAINARNRVEKAKYLAIDKERLPKGVLKSLVVKIKSKKLESMLNNKIWQCYDKLLTLVMDGFVEDSMQQIKATTMLVGDIEFYAGGLRFKDILEANGLPANRPTFKPMEDRAHDIEEMYNPMMNYQSASCSRGLQIYGPVIPNSFHVNPDGNILLVTGPNNGGKTRYTTGLGLVFALGQSGYHVPAKSAALSLVDNIFTHFVAGDDADNKRGRWVDEITRINKMMARMTPYSLSFIDDFGSGTNYLESRVPALNVLYGHFRLGTTLLMNSHLHQLALDIEKGDFPTASNWQVEADETDSGVRYTFRIMPGNAGRSFAQRIAEDYGLSRTGIDAMIAKRLGQGNLPAELIKPAKEINYD